MVGAGRQFSLPGPEMHGQVATLTEKVREVAVRRHVPAVLGAEYADTAVAQRLIQLFPNRSGPERKHQPMIFCDSALTSAASASASETVGASA